jgi:nitrogen fixation NifU-like protein
VSRDELYNDAILAEARAGHRTGRLDAPDASSTCDNPLCGDRVTIDVALADGKVTDLAQKARGCLLTQAAASVIGRHGRGLTLEEARGTQAALERLLAGEAAEPGWPELSMFAPVAAVRSRHECVLLPFRALIEALRSVES